MTQKEIVDQPESAAFIMNNWNQISNKEMAKHLGVCIQTIRDKCYRLGLYRMRLEYWTPEQIEYLVANYKTFGDKELAEIFNKKWKKEKGWSHKHIEKKRLYLKIKRTHREIQDIRQRNIDNGRYLLANVRRWDTRGRSEEGEIRYWREQSGRMIPRIKISGKFIHWARWRYEQMHGPVPQGMNVVFLDNNPRNITDENLGLFTDGELSKRNSQTSSIGLSDNYVAAIMTIGDPELRKEIKKNPQLIELKRTQLNLKRVINERRNNNTAGTITE
ncbi:MAG: HNH endonuclease [Taibaiella sp.]|jgi:hypothetical protein